MERGPRWRVGDEGGVGQTSAEHGAAYSESGISDNSIDEPSVEEILQPLSLDGEESTTLQHGISKKCLSSCNKSENLNSAALGGKILCQ